MFIVWHGTHRLFRMFQPVRRKTDGGYFCKQETQWTFGRMWEGQKEKYGNNKHFFFYTQEQYGVNTILIQQDTDKLVKDSLWINFHLEIASAFHK